MLKTALTTIPFLLSARERTQTVISAVNQRCAEMQLPDAFGSSPLETGQTSSRTVLGGNPLYRFEGFGFVLGFRPKLSFWVHYKKGTSDHQELGRFLIDLNTLGEIGLNLFSTDKAEQIIEQIEGNRQN